MTYWIAETAQGAGDGSSEDNAANIATHNLASIGAGETIALADSETIDSQLEPKAGCTYQLARALINPITGIGVWVNNADDVTINDFRGNGNGKDSLIEVSGTSDNCVINDPQILSNGSTLTAVQASDDCDGISINNTAVCEVNNPYIRDCFNAFDPDASSNNSHQALTAHDDSVLAVNNADVDNCTMWAVPTNNARIYLNGGRFKGAILATLELASSCTNLSRLVADNCVLENNGGARPPSGTSTTSINAMMLVRGGKFIGTNGAQASNRNTVTFQNVKFEVNNGAANFRHHTISGGITNLLRCDLGDWVTSDGYTLRAESGTINLIGNILKSFDDSGGRFLTYDSNAGANGLVQGNWLGNAVNVAGQGFIWVRGTLVGTLDIIDNVFGNLTANNGRYIDNDGVIDNLNYNTFLNISNVIDNAGGASVTNQIANNYYNSENAGGSGGVVLNSNELNAAKLIATLKGRQGANGQVGVFQ